MNYIVVVTFILCGWAEDFDYNSEETGSVQYQPISPISELTNCLVPPQPSNGRWKLHQSLCDDGLDYNIPQGISLQIGSQLVYSCDPGFRTTGNTDVYCVANGSWSPIPKCIEIKCPSLDSESTKGYCGRLGTWMRCNAPVLPKTQAKSYCRDWYKEDEPFLRSQEKILTCNADGKWEPDPVTCVPDCGKTIIPDQIDSVPVEIWKFPWRASLYTKTTTSNKTSIEFLCGGTIVDTNFILTAAHCVYDMRTKSTVNSEKLLVVTGNVNVDYDSSANDPGIMNQRQIKNIYIPDIEENLREFQDDFSSDIALVELQQPFVLSSILLPACLYLQNDEYKFGAFGKIAGFGNRPRIGFSNLLQIVTEPYSTSCRSKLDNFCTGSRNGTIFLERGGGGGLVFNVSNRWYVKGISSSHIGWANGRPMYGAGTYSVYTTVSYYLPWIMYMISKLGREKSQELCKPDWSPIETKTPTPNEEIPPFSNLVDHPCTVPSQPDNGKWISHGHLCGNKTDCEIPQGAVLKPGSQLVYSCASGYRASGNTVVYCGENGSWSDIPICVEVKCSPLNSVSTMASCSLSGKWVSCDSPVPLKTEARVSCSPGYKKDTVSVGTQKEVVNCTDDGKWQPDPVKCVPVCGVEISHNTPFVINGTVANITDFPWHATLYKQTKSSKGIKKDFICGATIIHPKFLLTAAHCVFDEVTSTTMKAKNFFVMTGNNFRDYDFPMHNPAVVRKAAVKYVYTHSNYYGSQRNYAADIALLELQQPFNLSGILLPACLDIEGYSQQIIESEMHGRVAGFGRTATAKTSAILRTVSLPYISFPECTASRNDDESKYLITNDKFCAGYNNGTALCEGDSGGGLVFQRNGLSYILGIVSVSLDADLTNGEKTCDRYSYTLFTKVSTYLDWIQNVISNPERYKLHQDTDPATPGPNINSA